MDNALKHRVNAGRVAVHNQIAFFREQFGQVGSEWKQDDSRVTFADFAISENVFAELRRSFPGDDYCSEESNPADETQALESKYAWIIDPIDGTNNYALGIPACAISLALLKNNEPVYGFVYDYGAHRLIEGGPGLGLHVGKRRLEVEPRPFTPREAIIGIHFPLPGGQLGHLAPILSTYRVRSSGSGTLNLAYAALGMLDVCIDFKVKVWDIAAAYALALAAGCPVRFFGESPFPLHHFHVNAPLLPYYAGSAEFCRLVEGLEPGA